MSKRTHVPTTVSTSPNPSPSMSKRIPKKTHNSTTKRTTKSSRLPAPRFRSQSAALPQELQTGLSLAQLGPDLARANLFLVTLFDTGKHGKAIGKSGLGWGTLCRLRASHPDFDSLYRRVLAKVDLTRVQQAREALHERAVNGVERPVFQGGRRVGTVREYSDKLLETELKALDPATFGPPEDAASSGVRITINLSGVATSVSPSQAGDLPATLPKAAMSRRAQPVDVDTLAQEGHTGTQPDSPASHAPDAPPAS